MVHDVSPVEGFATEAVVDLFGPDVQGPLILEAGSGLFRPEVVLSRKAGSNPISGERSRISGVFSCSGRHDERNEWFPARGQQACEVHSLADVVFRLRSEKPSSSLGSRIVFPSGRVRRLPSPIYNREART
jgi:hypothetical protein